MTVTAAQLARRMAEPGEWALLDVQEAGPFADGHIFHACHVPYSRLELRAPALVPRRTTPIVVTDGEGGSTAALAVRRLASLGYTDVQALVGGNAAWTAFGQRLFQGVHVPSKTFGELVEHRCATPSLSPQEFLALRESGRRIALLDGRPWEEYQLFTIPGSTCCPNGELALRAEAMAADAEMVVVNCAGRTRSIIGAETLRRLQAAKPVYALRNGTQGWFLAGQQVERGASRRYPEHLDPPILEQARARAQAFGRRHPAPCIDLARLQQWESKPARTTYLLDVRTPDEWRSGTLPGAACAPGGQLLQATDLWVGVHGARVVVFDREGVRAPVIAAWLQDMGLEAYVLTGASDAAFRPPVAEAAPGPQLPGVRRAQLVGWRVVDLRASAAFRLGHVPGAHWSTRSRLPGSVRAGDQVALVADEPEIARIAAVDAREAGAAQVAWLEDPAHTDTTPDDPPDAERIDHVFFTALRHSRREDAERYLSWETNLLEQMGPLEWQRFPAAWRPR